MTDRWAALRRVMEKATAGPWRLSCPDDTSVICDTREIAEAAGDYDNYDDYSVMEANAAFIALARNELPALLEENERLTAALAKQDIENGMLLKECEQYRADGIDTWNAAIEAAANLKYNTAEHIARDMKIGMFPDRSETGEYMSSLIRALRKETP